LVYFGGGVCLLERTEYDLAEDDALGMPPFRQVSGLVNPLFCPMKIMLLLDIATPVSD
jgi:hypothetical protein